MWLNSSKWTSWVRSSKLMFFYFLNGCSSSSILLQFFFWNCTLHSQDNLIHYIKIDLWKVHFEKRALRFGNLTKVLEYNSNSKVHFHMKNTILRPKKIVCLPSWQIWRWVRAGNFFFFTVQTQYWPTVLAMVTEKCTRCAVPSDIVHNM